MSIEIRSEEAQKFLYDSLENGLMEIYGQANFAKLSSQKSEVLTTLARSRRNLVFESRSAFSGSLFVYGLGFEGRLELGFFTLTDLRSPENNFAHSASFADEILNREHWQLYAPNKPLPPQYYSQFRIPDLQNALIKSVDLALDSADEDSRVLRAWRGSLNDRNLLPILPISLLERLGLK